MYPSSNAFKLTTALYICSLSYQTWRTKQSPHLFFITSLKNGENQLLQFLLKYISENLGIDLTSFMPHFFQFPEVCLSKTSLLVWKGRQDVLRKLCKDSSHEKFIFVRWSDSSKLHKRLRVFSLKKESKEHSKAGISYTFTVTKSSGEGKIMRSQDFFTYPQILGLRIKSQDLPNEPLYSLLFPIII